MSRRRLPLLLALAVTLPRAATAQGGGADFDLGSLQLPPGFLDLTELQISGVPGGGLTATAKTTLGGAVTEVFLASGPGPGGKRSLTFALRPRDWSLTRAIPALANPALDDLTLSNVTLILTDQDVRTPSVDLADDVYAFYREVYNADDFTVVLKPGINLIAAIPVDGLPAGHPLLVVMDALGIEKGTVLLQGTLGKSLTTLTGGGGAAGAIKDLYLRVELPPMRPPGSPQWFRSGQLALELTGDPSVRLVGEMNVLIDDADLQFFLAAALARTGVSLTGGMKAVEPWVAPFGIEWLTMKQVILKIGITPTGSVALGFAGAAVIGEKDIDVAMALAISPAGVPTNFMMRGESEAGVAISDLARVQAGMAAAREAAAGATGVGTGQPLIPFDALPDIQIRSLGLQFAPKPDVDLGIERGFKIKGRLWLPMGAGGELTDFAGVDAAVTDDGLWIRGDLGAFQLGPLTWQDAKLDLTATREDQHLLIQGDVELFTARQKLDVRLTKTSLDFHSLFELYGLFRATVDATAAFDLRRPRFQVDAVVENDFAEYVQPILRVGVEQFARRAEPVVRQLETTLAAFDQALAAGQTTAAQLRAVLVSQRATAEQNWRAAQTAAEQAQASAAAAANARNAAYSAWANTPLRQPSLRAQRRNQWLQWVAIYSARAAAYAGLRATADTRRAILDVIPPPDRNVLLLSAEAAVATLRAQLQATQTELVTLRTRLQLVLDAMEAGVDPFTVERAEIHANLDDLLGGQAVRWSMRGRFLGQPYTLDRGLNFSDPAQAVADLLTGLLRG